MVNWFPTNVERQFSGGMTAFSIHDAGKTGDPHQNKQKTLDPITIKKLTQSGLRSNCKSQNFKISEEYTGETEWL